MNHEAALSSAKETGEIDVGLHRTGSMLSPSRATPFR